MDNKITRERISVHFEYDWLKYLLLLIASVFAVYMIFYQINVNREFEKIDVFLTCYGNNIGSSVIANEYKEYLKDEGDTTIRSVTIEMHSQLESEYGTLLSSHGTTADLLVLSKSQMDSGAYAYFVLTDEIVDRFIPKDIEVEYYIQDSEETPTINGNRYGIRIDNLPGIKSEKPENAPIIFDPSVLSDEVKGDKKYDSEFYLVVNPSSVNKGEFNRKEKNKEKYKGQCQTLQFLTFFLTNQWG